MRTFRAYIADASGTITWAAWIEAAHLSDARRLADTLSPSPNAAVDLWSEAAQERPADSLLEAV